MSIFNKIFKKRSFYPVNSIQVDSKPGGTFRANYANDSTVLSCINLITQTLAITEFSLVADTRKGYIPATFHDAFYLVQNPAREETSILFYQTLIRQLLGGNAFIFKEKKNGLVRYLTIIDNEKVTIRRDALGNKHFIILGAEGDYTADDIIHIPYSSISYNGTKGFAPWEEVKKEIYLKQMLDTFMESNFDSSVGKRLIVQLGDSYKNLATEDAYKQLIPLLQKFVTGAVNAGKTGILPPDTKMAETNSSVNALDQLDSFYLMLEKRIASAYNVPIEMLENSENKYSSLDSKERSFLLNCIVPLGNQIEQSFNRGLLDPVNDSNLTFWFNHDSRLAIDTVSNSSRVTNEFAQGVITLDEARKQLGYLAFGDEKGNTIYQPKGNANLLTNLLLGNTSPNTSK